MHPDWTPVITAIAIAIPTLAAAVATLLVSIANHEKITSVQRGTNGANAQLSQRVAELQQQVIALHAAAAQTRRAGDK